MIEGKRLIQISRLPRNLDGTQPKGLLELDHYVKSFRQYLPAGPTEDGGYRDKDLIQFYSEPPKNKSGSSGLRTVAAQDIVIP